MASEQDRPRCRRFWPIFLLNFVVLSPQACRLALIDKAPRTGSGYNLLTLRRSKRTMDFTSSSFSLLSLPSLPTFHLLGNFVSFRSTKYFHFHHNLSYHDLVFSTPGIRRSGCSVLQPAKRHLCTPISLLQQGDLHPRETSNTAAILHAHPCCGMPCNTNLFLDRKQSTSHGETTMAGKKCHVSHSAGHCLHSLR